MAGSEANLLADYVNSKPFDQSRFPLSRHLLLSNDPKTGDVTLSHQPASRDDFFSALKCAEVPPDFLDEKERNQGAQDRDPLEGLGE